MPISHTKAVNVHVQHGIPNKFSFPLSFPYITGVMCSYLTVCDGMMQSPNLCEMCKAHETGYDSFQFQAISINDFFPCCVKFAASSFTVRQYEYWGYVGGSSSKSIAISLLLLRDVSDTQAASDYSSCSMA